MLLIEQGFLCLALYSKLSAVPHTVAPLTKIIINSRSPLQKAVKTGYNTQTNTSQHHLKYSQHPFYPA